MPYEQLLHDFIDGSLGYSDELVLFTELGTNEELRQELKLLLLMQQAVACDARAYTPAPASQEAIFERLGFAPAPATPPTAGTRRFVWPMQGIVGGIVGALLTALVFLGSGRGIVRDAAPAGTAPRASAQPASAATASAERPSPATTYRASVPNAGATASSTQAFATANGIGTPAIPPSTMSTAPAAIPVRTHPLPLHVRRSTLPIATSAEPTPATPTAKAAELAPTAIRIAPPLLLEGNRGEASPQPLPPSYQTTTSPVESVQHERLLTFETEYRAMASMSTSHIPDALAGQGNGLLDDKALAIRYRLDDHSSIGLEAGRERFYQHYSEQRANGDLVAHDQNPALLWGGVSYRYTLATGTRFEPYAQACAGATINGPLARVLVGTAYEVTPELRLFAGGEFTDLAFKFDGTWYTSPKYGFTYGFSLRF